MAFYYDDFCNDKTKSTCTNDYNNSNVKKVVDSWFEDNFDINDVVSFDDDYNVRLLNNAELKIIDDKNNCGIITNTCPVWLANFNYYSWTMEKREKCFDFASGSECEQNNIVQTIPYRYSYLSGGEVYEGGSVRPTVKLKKKSLTKVKITANEYHNNEIREYKIGDIINYNETKFFVIKNSDLEDETVTVLKANPLTEFEIKKYELGHINNYIINVVSGEVVKDDVFSRVAYLSTIDCHNLGQVWSEDAQKYVKDIDYAGCSSDYETSDVKFIVDRWGAETINNDDLSLDSSGYKARLINENDLMILDYISVEPDSNNSTVLQAGNGAYKFMFNDNTNDMLTMISTYSYILNYQTFKYDKRVAVALGKDRGYNFRSIDLHNAIGTVRPVITLNKKEIEKKITNVEEDKESDNIEVTIETEVNNEVVVNVPNTLLNKTTILIAIGIVSIMLSITLYMFIKKKK